MEFPNLSRKFGPIVTYDESPHGHIRTEFAFDVEELTSREFAPPLYLRFIGFKVPRKFLEKAFINIYGFDIHEVLGRAHPALRSYRTSVRSFTRAGPLGMWSSHHDLSTKAPFVFRLARRGAGTRRLS